jgi:2-keto-3-deoxy-L-rhamnonate aldolase RhmA
MKHYVDLGVQFILTGSDHAYMVADASHRSAFFRKIEADRKP